MCQLFALSSRSPADIRFSYAGFSARGGATGEHADGFGVAFHDGDACRLFVDEGAASQAPLADFLRTHPIRATATLAHVRKATQGQVRLANCHPFVREWQGRQWSFCHNGDLKDFRPCLTGADPQPVGDTDSERAFCWILRELRRACPGARRPDWRRVAKLLSVLAERVARHGSFNFLLSDGVAVYAHASTRLHWLQRRPPFGVAHLVDRDVSVDLGQVNSPEDLMALVATEPLTRDEDWQVFEPGELRVFVGGESVWHQVARPHPATRPSLKPRRVLKAEARPVFSVPPSVSLHPAG